MPFELAIDSNYWISSRASSWDVGKLDFFLFLVYKVFQKNLSLTANRTLKISRYGLLNKYISLQSVIYSFGDLGITLNYLKLIFIYNLPISKTTFFASCTIFTVVLFGSLFCYCYYSQVICKYIILMFARYLKVKIQKLLFLIILKLIYIFY